MITYILPPEGNLYKANLHCHSTVSDGKFTPEQLKEMYKSRGYSAIAFTDHQCCVPHNELTESEFVALTGLEIAFGIGGTRTSVHACGISRDPITSCEILNEVSDDVEKINAGIRHLHKMNFITTLNHPRWSGILPENMSEIIGIDNIEAVNGFEMIQDGYGDSVAYYEAELRRGRKVRPIASDDSHTMLESGEAGLEYFRGFTVLKAPTLTYEALISALDSGAFFASTGPMIHNLWLDGNILHIECSPVCGVYIHGKLYSHRAAVIRENDSIECIDIDAERVCDGSEYLFVQIVDTKGGRALSSPIWFK